MVEWGGEKAIETKGCAGEGLYSSVSWPRSYCGYRLFDKVMTIVAEKTFEVEVREEKGREEQQERRKDGDQRFGLTDFVEAHALDGNVFPAPQGSGYFVHVSPVLEGSWRGGAVRTVRVGSRRGGGWAVLTAAMGWTRAGSWVMARRARV